MLLLFASPSTPHFPYKLSSSPFIHTLTHSPPFSVCHRCDDQIYTRFREQFPDVKVDIFDVDASKTPEGKEAWRKFMEPYDDEIVKDFNFATLMRIDSSKPCDESNTCIVPRIQFLAIELARSREGHNNEPKLE